MEVIYDLAQAPADSDSVVTIGAFDGVHLGHQALIRQSMARARTAEWRGTVITFHPHPSEVVMGQRIPLYLTSPEEKAAILEGLGVDLLVVLNFTRRLADTSASGFLALLRQHLRLRELWVGPSFALGHDRIRDFPTLFALGRELGFEVQRVEPVVVDGEPVTSSRVRQTISGGDMFRAASLLGRPYSVSGEVIHGDHRGRELGFPTANLAVPERRVLPPDGIYAGFSRSGGTRYGAVMNLGVRLTFGGGRHLLEVHLLDFAGDLYGADLSVEFVERLRPELRFDSVEKLVEQMRRDRTEARQILAAQGQAR